MVSVSPCMAAWLMHDLIPTDRRSYLPEQRVTMYMYQLCKAIYHMHRNGIFHRDVKPENILIKVQKFPLQCSNAE